MADPQCVFFDLDGTLIDHFDAIHESFTHVAKQMGYEVPSYEKVVATVGGSVPVTSSRLFPGIDVEEAVQHFEARFEEVMYEGARNNEGAEWILEGLKEKGIRTVVFTNKGGERARQVCEYLGLTKWVYKIIGTGDVPFRKPQREFTEYALEQAEANAENSCLVGDSPFDEHAAMSVGMPSFLVATGSHDTQTLEKETNSKVFSSLYKLGESVFNLPLPELVN